MCASAAAQELYDPNLRALRVADGLGADYNTFTSAMTFVDADTALVADRGDGQIRRLDLVDGSVVQTGATVVDLDIIVGGHDFQSEYGIQSLTAHPDFATNKWVYVRYDRSLIEGVDTPQKDVVFGLNFSASQPTTNVIERYVWDAAANGGDGALVFDAVIHEVTMDTRYHHGGPIVFDDSGHMYVIYGDLRRDSNEGWKQFTDGALAGTNFLSGVVDDLAVIVRLNDDGTAPADNPFIGSPLSGTETWFAYGVRNSFGLAIDPVSGDLWDTQNGEAVFDEINRVQSGDNLGWKRIMGPVGHPNQTGSTDSLLLLPGATYRDPLFSWHLTIGVTGIEFLHGSALGPAYDDALLVGGFNAGTLWLFRLNTQRDGLVLSTPGLQDAVDDRNNPLQPPIGTEAEEVAVGFGFGGIYRGVLSIERGLDGLPYVLTGDGELFRIEPATFGDLTGDDVVNVADLVMLLANWGNDGSGANLADARNVVDVLDLLVLLRQWG